MLSQFNSADFLDYKSKINFETTDLITLQKSLEDYLNSKTERKKEAENQETIKTKLFGLEDLYKKYRYYELIAGQAEAYFTKEDLENEETKKVYDQLVASEKHSSS